MIKATLAFAAVLTLTGAAVAQNSMTPDQMGSGSTSMSAPNGMNGTGSHSGSMKSGTMKKKSTKGTSHNGRSGMPASGTDSSMPMDNSSMPMGNSASPR